MIYVFRCRRHGVFEKRQSMFEEHTADCPECHTIAERVFTAAALTWGAKCWDYDRGGLGDNLILRHHA